MSLYPFGKIQTTALFFCAVSCSVSAEDGSSENLEEMIVWDRQLESTLQAEQALTPGGVSLLDSTQLLERNTNNLSDALRYTPGIWATSTSGGDSIYFSSRGSNLDATNYDMNGIKLLQDGMPVTTADGNNHNRIIDPLASRFATIARGANALKYGASTLGGAMDFVTPTARNSNPNQLLINGGSYDQRQLRLSLGSVLTESVDAMVSVEAKHWGGYRDHSESDRDGVYANLGWQISDTVETRFFATYLNNDEALAGALTAAELADDPNQAGAGAISGNFQVNVQTERLANKTTFTLAENQTLEMGVYAENQELFHPIVDKVMVDFDGPGPAQPVEVFSLLINTEQKSTGAMLRYHYQLGDHQLVAGINWGETTVEGGNYRNDNGHKNGLSTIIDNRAENTEVFLMDRWAVSKNFTLIYGLQGVYTDRDVRNTDVASGVLRNPSGSYESLNPRIGAIYALNENVELFGNISKLYEAPTNFELEDDARADSSLLDAMQGQVVEVGSRGSYPLANEGFWRWDVSLYYAQIEDEILSRDDPSVPGTSLSANVDDTVHAGVEMLINGSLPISSAARIEPLISLTLNEFTFDNDATYGDNTMPAAPDYAVHGELLYRHSNGFYAGPTFDFVGERYVDFINSETVDRYSLVGFRMGLNRESWQVYLDFRNLTDEEYISSFSVVDSASADSGIFNSGEPRSAYAGVVLRF